MRIIEMMSVIAGMFVAGTMYASGVPDDFCGENRTGGDSALKGMVIAPYDNGVFGFEIIRDFFTGSGREIVKIVGLTQEDVSEISEIVVPDEIECKGKNYPVGMIGVGVFNDLDNLKSVTLPPSIVIIEPNFRNCQRLETVVMPEGLQGLDIGGSFHECPALRSLTVPASASAVGPMFLVGCGVRTLTFCGNASMGGSSVMSLYELETINFGGHVYLWELCLSGLRKLSSISLRGTGIKELPCGVLSYCDALEEVCLPDEKNLYIDNTVLTYCRSLCRVYSPNVVPPVVYSYNGAAEFGGLTGAEGSVDKEACVLYVPEGAADAYRADPGWSAFTHIVEYDFASEAVIEADSLADENCQVEYYDLNGRRVDAPSRGIFIRRQGASVTKMTIP